MEKEKYDFYIGLYINDSINFRKINQFSVSKDSPSSNLLCAVSKFAQKIRVTIGFSSCGASQTVDVAVSNIPVWQSYNDGDMYIGSVETSGEYTGLVVLKKI